jgi:Mrp family chromosome partitioning ATPase
LNVEDKQAHLIERAAARLAQLPAAQPKLVVDPRGSTARNVSDWQSSPDREAGGGAVGARERALQIDSASLEKAGLIRQLHSRVAEEFRIIQNRVVRQSFGDNGATASGSSNLVMITSAVKGEGKSFISINLAGEVARQGDRRVLLVDTDPKHNRLTQSLGLARARGLLDLARDNGLEVADVMIPAAENLDVLALGIHDERSGEVFASRRMGEVIEELGRRYADRLIIFDAPPCLSSSAPHTLAAVCGQTVLVVAANSTQQGDIEAALDLLQVCPRVSLMLNKVPSWMGYPVPEA